MAVAPSETTSKRPSAMAQVTKMTQSLVKLYLPLLTGHHGCAGLTSGNASVPAPLGRCGPRVIVGALAPCGKAAAAWAAPSSRVATTAR